MKTIKELHAEYQKRVGTDSEIRPTNIDDTLRYAKDAGIKDVIFDDHSMDMLFWFVTANYQMVPWELISSGWIPRFWGVTFHKEDVGATTKDEEITNRT